MEGVRAAPPAPQRHWGTMPSRTQYAGLLPQPPQSGQPRLWGEISRRGRESRQRPPISTRAAAPALRCQQRPRRTGPPEPWQPGACVPRGHSIRDVLPKDAPKPRSSSASREVWTVTKDSGKRGRGCSHLPGMLHCGGSGSRRPRPKARRGRRAFPEVLRGAGASLRKPTATALCERGQSGTAREDPPGGFSLPRCQSEGES